MELKLYIECLSFTREPLLIVPYGIETFQPEFANIGFQPFNRTLWN